MLRTLALVTLASFILAEPTRTSLAGSCSDARVPVEPTPPTVGPAQDAPADTVVEAGTARAFALLCSAVLFERNGWRHDLLAGVPRDKKNVDEMKQMLADDWDIKTAEHLQEQMEWLRTEGHRVEFLRRMQAYSKVGEKEFEKSVAKLTDEDEKAQARALYKNGPRVLKLKSGLLAWDYGRWIALCRWGYCVGFLTEEEAWKKMDPIARDLQRAYSSWDELGELYCIGRECWKPGKNAETLAAFEKLKTDEKSPLKTTPWSLKLEKLDKAPPKKPDAKKKG
jgi:hypothetical protein